MKTLVVYDSVKGNTEIIAQAIGKALGANLRRSGVVKATDLESLDLVLIGSPTYGGRPTKTLQAFLAGISLPGMRVAVFDTRLSAPWVKLFGFAADKMAKSLTNRGVTLIGAPTGFYVKGSNGPLREGEVERAVNWAQGLKA
jgi:flavodoxin I